MGTRQIETVSEQQIQDRERDYLELIQGDDLPASCSLRSGLVVLHIQSNVFN